MITKSGLELIECTEEEMTYRFKSKEQIKDFFSADGSQIKFISDTRKDEFLNDFVTEHLKRSSYSQVDLIPVSFWCLHVIASKPKQYLIKINALEYPPKLFSKFTPFVYYEVEQ